MGGTQKRQVNMAKTKEIVFRRQNISVPSELPGIERELCAKLLGVWLQADMDISSRKIPFLGHKHEYAWF